MDFQSLFENINLTSSHLDVLIFVGFTVGLCLYLLRWGKDKAFIALISSYISLALVEKIDLVEKVLGFKFENSFANKTILFLAVVLVLFFVLSRSSFTSVFNRSSSRAWFQTLVIGFLQIGLMISIIFSFLSPAETNSLSIFLKSVFVDDGAQLFWFVSPFFAIFLLKDK